MTVGRFQVMSVLQAARAYTLGLPLESAYSWGLNRAIYIAAAKKGFKGGKGGDKGKAAKSAPRASFKLGDDMAFKTEKDGVMLFTIGGEVQTKEAFDKQVVARFGSTFDAAWKEALTYVESFPKETLLSTDGFFGDVYRPRRDQLSDKWTMAAEVGSG